MLGARRTAGLPVRPVVRRLDGKDYRKRADIVSYFTSATSGGAMALRESSVGRCSPLTQTMVWELRLRPTSDSRLVSPGTPRKVREDSEIPKVARSFLAGAQTRRGTWMLAR